MKSKKLFIIFFSIIFILFNTTCFALDQDSLTSQAAILMDAKTGNILFEKNIDQKLYPASLTKIMTAILAIEHCNLDDTVTVNYNALSSIPYGYTSAGLVTDEELTVKQLLEVLLVHSANDAANVLAMHIGGSLESFATMMNSKAKELKCENTNFTNAYGLHDENHYSTARDLAIITKYCMQNTSFRHFVAQRDCQIAPTNKHEARTYPNTNDLINPDSKYYYPNTIGVKTGYTKEAGNCQISAVNKDGFETIAVVLNTGTVSGARSIDSIALFDYAYNNYRLKEIAKKGDVLTEITVFNGTQETRNLNVILSEDIEALTAISDNNEKNEIKPTINIKQNVFAPIAKGAVVGTATYEILNVKYTVDLVAEHDVEKSDYTFYALCIGLAVVVLIIVILIIVMIRKNRVDKYRYKF